VGLVVCSVQANTLNTSMFDNVTVTLGSPSPSTPNIVVSASDNDHTVVSK